MGTKPSDSRVLGQNKIEAGHYAIDDSQRTVYTNAQTAASAVRDALARGVLDVKVVRFLVAATSQGNLPLRGLVNNKRPVVPSSTLGAAHGLMLHGPVPNSCPPSWYGKSAHFSTRPTPRRRTGHTLSTRRPGRLSETDETTTRREEGCQIGVCEWHPSSGATKSQRKMANPRPVEG